MVRLIVNTRCHFCGEQVEMLPDRILRQNPHQNNVEYVVTRSGYKQYFHTSCWYEMIKQMKKGNIG